MKFNVNRSLKRLIELKQQIKDIDLDLLGTHPESLQILLDWCKHTIETCEEKDKFYILCIAQAIDRYHKLYDEVRKLKNE